ncbi:hypothetical protein I4U23_027517 [Adineta vaga]|nr:hypothetical protein I4U23_027517 [Adineta vaga]
MDQAVSYLYAESSKQNPNMIGVFFHMEIDPTIASAPFVELKNISYFDEEREVLFSTHTIFRIEDITKIEERFWKVQLTLTGSNDEKLVSLGHQIRNELQDEKGWRKFAQLLFKMGRFHQAEHFYQTFLCSTSPGDWKNISSITNQLACIYNLQGWTMRFTDGETYGTDPVLGPEPIASIEH